jgi:two-component system response regulator DevR
MLTPAARPVLVSGVACLMFTAFSDDRVPLDSIIAGAAGYVLKEVRGCDLAGAVRAAAAGRSLLHPRAASQLMAGLLDGPGKPGPLAGLTPHERNVLVLMGEGLTNRQIGERLFISEKTVKTYASTKFRKLGFEQRTQAAAYVARIVRSHGRSGPGHNVWITAREP